MPNKMLDSLFCECGGKYEHVDCQENDDEATIEGSYQCDKCETWCIVTWDKETEKEIKRRYEEPDNTEDLSLSDIIQLLDNEIKWCKDNQEQAPGASGGWFIKGLEQAKYLILELAKVGPLDPLPNSEDLPRKIPGWMGDYGATPFGPVDV